MKVYLVLLIALFACLVLLTNAAKLEHDNEMKELETGLNDIAAGINKEQWRPFHRRFHRNGNGIRFLKCMGREFIEHCVRPTIKCLAEINIIDCIELIVCEGKSCKKCVHELREAKQSTQQPNHLE